MLLELRELQETAVGLMGTTDTILFGAGAEAEAEAADTGAELPPAAVEFLQTLREASSETSMYVESLVDLCEDMLYVPPSLCLSLTLFSANLFLSSLAH